MIHHRIHQRVKAHYHKHYRAKFQAKAHLVFIIDSVLVLCVLGLLGLGLYFKYVYHPLRDDFRFSIRLEGQPKTGENAVAVVRMINDGRRELRDAKLTVHLPAAFRASAFPAGYDEASHGVTIGRLAPKSSAEYRFEGLLLAPPGKARAFAHLTARDESGASDEKLVGADIEWGGTLIEASIQRQEPMVPNQPANVTFTLKNGSGLDFDQVQLVPKWPKGVRVRVATPPVARGVVNLGRIEAGETVRADFTIVNADAEPYDQPFSFEAVWIESKAVRTPIASAASSLKMIDARLEITAAPKDPRQVARPGDKVPFVVTYANRGALTLEDVRFSLAFDPRVAEDPSMARIETVERLLPGESGAFEVEARVKRALSPYVNDPQLSPKPTAKFDAIMDPVGLGLETTGTGTGLKVAGQARLAAAGRFFTSEGEQIGRGPLPPQVGKTTRYWLFVSVENGPTELNDARVTVTLPPYVAWTGRVSVNAGEEPTASGSQLSWTLGTLPRHSGTDTPVPTMSLEVALTPPESLVGKTAPLLLNAHLEAQDAWTGLTIEADALGLTTELPGDSGLRGRDTVRK